LIILVIASIVLTACGGAPTEAPEADEPAGEEPAEPAEELAVGIVLPTKDEPRWIQDETRFRDALDEAGYDVEILFSQGSSAKEKENVEALITKGVKVLIICPHDGNPLYLYAGAASDNNAFLFFRGAWQVLQPKVADGTFEIINSDEAVALSDKAELTRQEEANIIGQITTNWDFNVAKNLAESNLTVASADQKGDVFVLAPNDGTARAIADVFAADNDVTSYVVTGQDAEKASVQYIIDGKQSMTVLKDVRNLVGDAINAAVALLTGEEPDAEGSYDNGVKDVPAIPSEVIAVDADNVQEALIDSGYYSADEFENLP
jgi:putative multiple sugar transport system substrate-binding protein